jgi:hypothetical protein
MVMRGPAARHAALVAKNPSAAAASAVPRHDEQANICYSFLLVEQNAEKAGQTGRPLPLSSAKAKAVFGPEPFSTLTTVVCAAGTPRLESVLRRHWPSPEAEPRP